ncbi:MAG: hypothetical protein IPK21_21895 [Haliscomenobacter sp.]|nr:hypothetical protein [Haliscomenobacter sp.]
MPITLRWQFEDRLELIKGRIFKMSPPQIPATSGFLPLFYFSYTVFPWETVRCFLPPLATSGCRSARKRAITTVVQPDLCIICDPPRSTKGDASARLTSSSRSFLRATAKPEMRIKFDVYRR